MSTEGVMSETIVVPIASGGIAERITESYKPAGPENSGSKQERIKYRVEYVEITTGNVLHRHETKGLNLDDEAALGGAETVFELVTTIRTGQKDSGDEKLTRIPHAGSAASVSMHILSGAIVHALRSVVQYYPGQDLSNDVVKVASPYAILVHHYDELTEYRERAKSGAADEKCYREKDAYEHLGILKEFLDEHVMPAVEAERARNKRGAYTFDMYWVMMKPGTTFVDHFTKPPEEWTVNYWMLEYNGTFVERVLRSSSRDKFDGEGDADTKPLILDDLSGNKKAEDLIGYGKLYWRLLRKQCRYYKGKTKDYPHTEVDGLVMVDMDAYLEAFPGRRCVIMASSSDKRTWVSDCTCSVCAHNRDMAADKKTTVFEDYDSLPPKTRDELDAEQYLLLPSHVYAYVFRTRTWGRLRFRTVEDQFCSPWSELLHVKGLGEPNFDEDMINQLVMDEKRVNTLKALAKSFIRVNKFGETSDREPWSADFVKGKAFQTAVALAEYEATKDSEGKIIMNDTHLRSVVEMSRDFKEYLKDLHRGDEGKRAERRFERLDK
ncbi:hypothetical protein SLS60_004553 [Paraconiothyrium brasiliense]|uniref:AAA+ ATPase lid domain-containing protein n=1 Tax=Paraconiothyrium brasiliense TaxID=300254 RepID=A0ABR3RKQ3_9PLEO